MEFVNEEDNNASDSTGNREVTLIPAPEKASNFKLPEFCGEIDQTKLPPVERVVLPRDVVEIKEDDDTVYVIGTKDGKVTLIDGLDHMKHLKTLVLRSCLISRMEGVENLVTLSKLELYDNQVEEISSIQRLSNLRVLDLSFNAIREMNFPFSACVPLLEELYLAQNKLRKIEGLSGLTHLRILDLGANRIRDIEGLESNISLKSLWLGKNKIEQITGLDSLVNLEQLDIQNNRLTSLNEGLRNLHKLRELYLACNRIHSLAGLPSPSNLNVIDLSTNGLSSLHGAEDLTNLEEFWMSSSAFHSFDELKPITLLPNLTCVYLEHSPISKDFEYRKTLTKMLPKLEQLDATPVHRI
eukprot:gene11234-12239_t